MTDFGSSMKTVILKGLEAIGRGASTLTSSAQQKLDEMDVEARRNELMKEIPETALKLWHEGVCLPEALCTLLAEWDELTAKRDAMKSKQKAPNEEDLADEPKASAAPTMEEKLKEMGEQIESAVEDAADAIEQFVEATADKVAGVFDRAAEKKEASAENDLAGDADDEGQTDESHETCSGNGNEADDIDEAHSSPKADD